MKIVELFAGSAAVSLRMLGGDFPPAPYMGAKRRHARAILSTVGISAPIPRSLCHFYETGPWAHVWRVLANTELKERVVKRLSLYMQEDPRSLWDSIREKFAESPSSSPVKFVCDFLTLQRWNFSNKPVYVRPDGQWQVHGFAHHHAYGAPPHGSYGKIHPQLPNTITRIRSLPFSQAKVCSWKTSAFEVDEKLYSDRPGRQPWLVYIDPPYPGTTSYGKEGEAVSSAAISELASRWGRACKRVALSIAERPPLLEGQWWETDLTSGGQHLSGISWQSRELLLTNFKPR